MIFFFFSHRHCKKIDGLTITLVGDLKYGRTVHSLAKLLTRFKNITINYVSPPSLSMPVEVMEYVGKQGVGIKQQEFTELDEALKVS